MLRRAAIPPHFNRPIHRGYCYVKAAIAVKVGKHTAAMQARRAESDTGFAGHVRKLAANVSEDPICHPITRVHAAAGYKKVEASIVIQIDQTTSPPAQRVSQAHQPRLHAPIFKFTVSAVQE